VIRPYDPERDAGTLEQLHKASNLPQSCLPDAHDPLFLRIVVKEHNGHIVMASALRGACEIYVLVDHTLSTPQERMEWLREIKDHMAQEAFRLGLDQIVCWVPAEIESAFAKRLIELGFEKSPWASYTALKFGMRRDRCGPVILSIP
jgi:hypothetical protein